MSSSVSRKFPRLVPEASVIVADEEARAETPAAAQVEPSPYLAGEVIGDRYRLVRELGRGGMGVVWVGYALALGVEVAVKLIRASVAGSVISSRMAREAHAAARLGHPALVRVFDFGWTSRGDPYLVMELVQGETLSAAIDREERISAIRAVQMLLPVADGLRLAHDRSIVHRDIKPDNIFLATDPLGRVQPKLLDFGIAKVGPTNVDGRLTQMGVVLGSPEYMSPEQALGIEDVDERTDVWSLSVVLYEMVTGNVPHRKSNYNALMQSIIHDDAPPMTDFEGCDAALWQVVSSGLAKDREQRFTTMAEFGEALALWLYEHGIKEDICGNSIRAVWLDGAISTNRVERVPSVPPARQEFRAKHVSRTAQTIMRRASLRPDTGHSLRFRRHRAWLGSSAILVLGLAALFLLTPARQPSGARPASIGPSAASERDPLAPTNGIVAGAALPSWHSPEEAPQESHDAQAVAPQSSNREGARNPSSRATSLAPKTKSTSASKPSEKSTKKRRDFGF
ncbi:MAG TPA: serine/threonine-protein kinase [Polyangiaceae bacterium]|nr:serine/threonine-protein kinase [Polyangiaceae bacterium]